MAPEQVVQVEPKRSKRLHHCATTNCEDANNEDQYYLQMIQQLVNDKIAFFSHHSSSSEEVVVIKHGKKRNKRPCSPTDDDEDEEYKKPIKKRKMMIQDNKTNVRSVSIERMKEFITGEMKGTELKLVIQKMLYATDLAKTQNRLSMPMKQLETLEFLTEGEKQLLDAHGEFEVPLLGPTLQMHKKPMVLRMWNLRTTSNYVLRTNWYHFVESNSKDMKEHRKVQVWSFRNHDHQLCFALACLDLENDAA